MPLETIGAIANVVTLFVVAISAFAAMRQLRHLRDSNQLQAILALVQDFQSERLQAALRYVQVELTAKLEDSAYRAELAKVGFVDPVAHPEMEACNWFNEMGTLVKNNLVDEDTFLDLFDRLVLYYWNLLAPAIAVLRRTRGDAQYESFEYLAAVAKRWQVRHPHGRFPSSVERLSMPDPWSERDAAPVSAL
jgi:hypothetical protein